MQHRHCLGIVIALTWLVCGCGGPDNIAQVNGTVALDGKPLPDAIVVFEPEGPGRPASAITDIDGNYTLDYTHKYPGALIGKHTVYIRTEMEASPERAPVREFLPARYHDKTELTAEVKSGSNVINFDLTSDK